MGMGTDRDAMGRNNATEYELNAEQIIETVEASEPENPFAHLSVCIIAHNNDKDNLKDLLPTLPKGCEVIVVFNHHGEDSEPVIISDETIGTTRMLFAEYTWSVFSFARARNYSLGYATRQWILWVDTDDIINPSQHDSLKNLVDIPAGVGALMVTVAGMQPGLFEGDDAKHYAVPQPRLIRNGYGFQFEGRCHEQITECIQTLGYAIQGSALLITHLGYIGDIHVMLKRMKRNTLLLMRECVERDSIEGIFGKLAQRDHNNYHALKDHA